jgi:HEPN domain-containing protein
MGIEEQIKYWKKAAELDFESAKDIFHSGKNFHFALFVLHLSFEKALKAAVTNETNSIPPKTHNLLRLSELAKIELEEDIIEFFGELNQFQLQTRYPDEKFKLYKLASQEFTELRFNKAEEVFKWLISLV